MKKRRESIKEQYTIIIASQTDARKKTLVLSITRRKFIVMLYTVIITMVVSAGIAAFSSYKASNYSRRITDLETQNTEQLTYNELSSGDAGYTNVDPIPGRAILDNGEAGVFFSVAKNDLTDAFDNEEATQYLLRADSHEPETEEKYERYTFHDYAISEEASVSMQMSAAIELINEEFKANIDESIAAAIRNQEYEEIRIVYDNNIDGDSDTVNNWADVLSVFAAETLYDDQKLLSISTDKIKLLTSIYNEMNELDVYTSKTHGVADDENTAGEEGSTDVLTVYVSVNSLTYLDGAELHDFDRRQLKRLEELMSPDYYIYFSELLGIDVYDGMEYEEVTEIIENLPENETGSTIVKAALIRLGSPYSKARRGSGNYVDCSYFAWWAYNQAGISIPTSSVEQAKYCYNNGYKVEKSDLKPGDLIFWSKKDCNCGRWHEIHHVGIYIGDDKIIDASSRKGRVVIRQLWGLDGAIWKIYMYARPY